MNWHLGFRRISAVFWGFWAAFFAMMGVFVAVDGGNGPLGALYLFLCLPVVYLLYRLTNWIIGGFFSK